MQTTSDRDEIIRDGWMALADLIERAEELTEYDETHGRKCYRLRRNALIRAIGDVRHAYYLYGQPTYTEGRV